MKILIVGASGQLGSEFVRFYEKECLERASGKKHEVFKMTHQELDVCDAESVHQAFVRIKPDVVINCSSYTEVDKAEEYREQCYAVNVNGTKNLTEACMQNDAVLVHFSTDYVFDGKGDSFREITDAPAPLNYYGQTKYESELEAGRLKKVFIFRISWIYGKNGNNFVEKMISLSKTHTMLKVVNDQIGSPTYVRDIVRSVSKIIETDKYGVYHVTNEGTCSWYEFACRIFELSGINIKVIPVSSEEYKAKAKRPKNSRLSKKCLDDNGFERLRNWEEALKEYLWER